MFYDITQPLTPALPVWPGDTPFGRTENLLRAHGETVNLSDIRMSLHAGTHADAPWHVEDAWGRAEALDLTAFVGPARVVFVPGRRVIAWADLEAAGVGGAERVLVRTDAVEDGVFPEAVPVLETAAIREMAARGVRLLGLDVPSVDALESKDLPNHRALFGAGLHLLENLRLRGVEPGDYELLALPLLIPGADAAPVRAILRR